MTPDEQYQKTIDDQRSHLLKLQDDFNKACETAKLKSQERLEKLPAEDKENREAVLQEQKEELEASLHILKTEIDHSTRETMKKLEKIVTEKENLLLAKLEKELARGMVLQGRWVLRLFNNIA